MVSPASNLDRLVQSVICHPEQIAEKYSLWQSVLRRPWSPSSGGPPSEPSSLIIAHLSQRIRASQLGPEHLQPGVVNYARFPPGGGPVCLLFFRWVMRISSTKRRLAASEASYNNIGNVFFLYICIYLGFTDFLGQSCFCPSSLSCFSAVSCGQGSICLYRLWQRAKCLLIRLFKPL